MFERPRGGARALVVHIDFTRSDASEDLDELRELVASAGVELIDCLVGTRPAPDPHYFVGQGKADEIHRRVVETCAEIVIFNHALSSGQERNLERLLGCRVLDRVGVILDVFAQRASSFEGKLQVELAQLKHISTRLVRGWTHLERQKGGIGLRGPGETQLETDRRLIGVRMKQINRRLESVRRRRDLSRKARRRASIPVVSLVGYTNAGKSTLFNRLTGAEVYTAGKMFATLDPTLRRLELSETHALILADTVGFIRHLPHDLVAAFRATLEETWNSSLLLHVIDGSAADKRLKIEQVNGILGEIGADHVPQIEVYNKIDMLCDGRPRIERDLAGRVERVWLSAMTGEGLELLSELLRERFVTELVYRRVRLPVEDGRLRARLFELGTVLEERLDLNGEWLLSVEIKPDNLERLCRSEGLDRDRVAA